VLTLLGIGLQVGGLIAIIIAVTAPSGRRSYTFATRGVAP